MPAVFAPIEKPAAPTLQLAYALSRRRFGVVPAVLKVLYARKPSLLWLAQKVLSAQGNVSLEPGLRALVQVQTARRNGCRFCEDYLLAQAYRDGIGKERFGLLADAQHSAQFSEREKAALALADEATTQRKVTDATWARVKACFSEVEAVELVWLNAAENYFNLQASVLGLESDGVAERT